MEDFLKSAGWGCLLSAVLAGLVVYLGMMLWARARFAALRGETEAESARLSERASQLALGYERQRQELGLAQADQARLRGELDRLSDDCARLEERARRIPTLEQDIQRLQEAVVRVEGERLALQLSLTEMGARLEGERAQAADRLATLNQAREQMTAQFKALADELLEEKSRRFAQQNEERLGVLLEPLRGRLQEFQGKVEQVYVQETKDRSALGEQVRQLMDLNRQLSDEANQLARALKGSNKIQGNWGEFILERTLEVCGLKRGQEYDVQVSLNDEDDRRKQPDVVLHLPGNRHLVIDAKVSLVAYANYVEADEGPGRDVALNQHLSSVRQHVRELSGKDYPSLYGLASLDFVLMFVPVEPAFMLAIGHDASLWQDAMEKNVLLVSPSTLLFVVRTVAHLWRQEQQGRNAAEIANQGAKLYEKLASFVDDLEKIGKGLRIAQESFDTACNKLSKGRGNALRQAEQLKTLGVKTKRQIEPAWLEMETPDESDEPDAG